MKRLSLVLPLLFLANCAEVNPRLQAPLKSRGTIEMQVAEQNQDLNTKIDILFVVDNSKSMTDEQVKLTSAIDQFVGAFAKNTTLDFHIGVTTVFDSKKYGLPGRQITPKGHLWPLVDLSTNPRQRDQNGLPYVTRETPNFTEVIRETLRIGVMDEKVGPVKEESFSPALAAVSDPSALQANRGFYRGDAYLLIIFLTDAEDGSDDLTPSLFYSGLLNLKGGDATKVMAHAAVWTEDCDPKNRDPDAKGKPTKILDLINKETHGDVFSLCQADYGANLAKIGIETTQKIGRRVINLSAVPDLRTLEVKYGSQTIPADFDHGWTYDGTRNALILSGDLTLNPEPGAKLSITFIPVELANTQNGQTTVIGK